MGVCEVVVRRKKFAETPVPDFAMVVGGEDAMADFGALRRRTFAPLRGGVRGGVSAVWWFNSMRVCV